MKSLSMKQEILVKFLKKATFTEYVIAKLYKKYMLKSACRLPQILFYRRLF